MKDDNSLVWKMQSATSAEGLEGNISGNSIARRGMIRHSDEPPQDAQRSTGFDVILFGYESLLRNQKKASLTLPLESY